jgi:transposase
MNPKLARPFPRLYLKKKKKNIAKIAREFNVSPTTLRSRLKKAKTPATPTPSKRNALKPYQEKVLTNWIIQMRNWALPPTASLIQSWANQAVARAGQPGKQVSKIWAYRFESRVPAHFGLSAGDPED